MAEVSKDRSGKAVIPGGSSQDIIKGGFAGQMRAIYRIFNGGQDGEAITIKWGAGPNDKVTVLWKCSFDIVVSNETINVTAGASKSAHVSYDLLQILTV